MPSRKKTELNEPFDYDVAHAELARTMTTLHISRIDELPRIELYLDQVLSIVTDELAPLYGDGEKVVTGSMVNNYVKQHVIPAPSRKRYTRRHLAALLVVCAVKRVLSIAQISQLIALLEEADVDLPASYDLLLASLEAKLAARFSASDGSIPAEASTPIQLHDRQGEPVTGQLPALMESTIDLLANKVHVEQLLSLEERRAKAQPLE